MSAEEIRDGAPSLSGLASEADEQGRDRPSRHGAFLGRALAKLAEAGRAIEPTLPDMCATCAFREGCMTNQMAATGLQALNCSIGVDPALFCCHHGLKDGEPTRVCAGYAAARLAPFETVKAVTAELVQNLDGASGPDEIRADFDAWIAEADPDGRLNDYERGRLYLRRPRTDQPLKAAHGTAREISKQINPETPTTGEQR